MRTTTCLLALLLAAPGCGDDTTTTDLTAPPADMAVAPADLTTAASPDLTGGGMVNAKEITVTVADSCPAFTACGGALAGAYEYSSACIEKKKMLTQLQAICPAMEIKTMDVKARGLVTFTGAMVAREVSSKTAGTFFVPATCLSAVVTCPVIENGMKAAVTTGSCVTETTGGCTCTFTRDGYLNENVAFTAMGNTCTIGTRTYDYCVAGNNISYVETTASATVEAGVFTMTKK